MLNENPFLRPLGPSARTTKLESPHQRANRTGDTVRSFNQSVHRIVRFTVAFATPVYSAVASGVGWIRRTAPPFAAAVKRSAVAVRRAGLPGLVTVGAPVLFVGAVFALMLSTAPKNASLTLDNLRATQPPQLEYILGAADADTSAPPETHQPIRIPPIGAQPALRLITYTVKRGDTLTEIANTYGVSIETIVSFNGIGDARFIQPGMELRIPTLNGILYKVRPGDTLEHIASAHGVAMKNILDVNHLTSAVIFPRQELFLPGAHMNMYAYRKALGTLFIWPTQGVITSPFGMRRDPFTGTMEFHAGIDIANSIGTAVDAAMDGRVIFVGRDRGYGNYILIDNGGGYRTLYAHLYAFLVSVGEYVRSGQEIGRMGDTGYSTGPHLHFAIFKNYVPVNPLIYLR